jgi:hypothetical protein
MLDNLNNDDNDAKTLENILSLNLKNSNNVTLIVIRPLLLNKMSDSGFIEVSDFIQEFNIKSKSVGFY